MQVFDFLSAFNRKDENEEEGEDAGQPLRALRVLRG
jgi:hypothetical protein